MKPDATGYQRTHVQRRAERDYIFISLLVLIRLLLHERDRKCIVTALLLLMKFCSDPNELDGCFPIDASTTAFVNYMKRVLQPNYTSATLKPWRRSSQC